MLYIIQVGHDDASDRYIRNKSKAIAEAGLKSTLISLESTCCTIDVILAIADCEEHSDCTAVMVQLPLPQHIDKNAVLRAIPADKDIDGLNPKSDFVPLTPSAIMRWLKEQNVELSGEHVTILGRSELVGKPLANLMIEAGATVSVCNSKTSIARLRALCRNSDIVVSAVGKPDIVDASCIGQICYPKIVIDVGINRNEKGKLCGDVASDAKAWLERRGGICTPVPGGVGKWTVRELVLRLKEMEGMSNGAETC